MPKDNPELQSSANSPSLIPVLASFIVIALLGFQALVYSGSGIFTKAYAQSPSTLPPPPSSEPGSSSGPFQVSPSDHDPPIIKVVTTELKEGKNILIAELTDASDIRSRQVKYVNEGKIRVAELARDHGNVYQALISVHGPTSIVVFDIVDAAGNKASVTKEFNVLPSSSENFFDQLIAWFRGIFGFLVIR